MRKFLLLAALTGSLVHAAGAGATATGWLTYGHDLARTSYTPERAPPAPKPHQAWLLKLRGHVTSQVLAADVPVLGRTLYVATTAGMVYAVAVNGTIRWTASLGSLVHTCEQLDSYGVTGTPVVDPVTSALYAVDAFGLLHAFDLATGAERTGWPVKLYDDFKSEMVWGALTSLGGAIYVGTGSYCDRPMEGKVIRVDTATRTLTSWIAVPRRLGGGGSIWGWGGVSYSPRRKTLLVVTGNAFRGGKNSGRDFSERAGFGEQLVELTPKLTVRAASHPRNISRIGDFDFVGAPLAFSRTGCGELVAALNKNGRAYLWRSGRIRDGPISSVRVAGGTIVSELAYSPRSHALYAVTYQRVVRIDTARCKLRVRWARRLGANLFNSSPTIARDLVWCVRNADDSTLLAVDARTGGVRFEVKIGQIVFAAPIVLGGTVYVGSFDGGLAAFPLG